MCANRSIFAGRLIWNLGLVENMGPFACPCCGETIELFKSRGRSDHRRNHGRAFLGTLPFDPQVVKPAMKGHAHCCRGITLDPLWMPWTSGSGHRQQSVGMARQVLALEARLRACAMSAPSGCAPILRTTAKRKCAGFEEAGKDILSHGLLCRSVRCRGQAHFSQLPYLQMRSRQN
jgi:hypothetical protein